MRLIHKIILPVFICWYTTGAAQRPPSVFVTIQSAVDSAREQMPREKIFIQFDKSTYTIGDTAWFKTYLFDAAYLTPSAQSGILYVDIANDENKVVAQYRLPVAAGVTWGNIALSRDNFKEGNYTLRAYTNWLRNFGDDYFFFHHFYIAGTAENSLLVNMQTQVLTVSNNDSIRALLKFSHLNKQPLAAEPLELSVATGKKTILKAGITTTKGGIADINFTLPANPQQVMLTALEKNTGNKVVLPVVFNRPENTDLQFMPEGGYLVAGLPAHVGFKAIGEDGIGKNVKGIIINSEKKQVASFQSLRKGMGCFDMLPAANEHYSAVVTLPNGQELHFPLPAVKQTGITLHVENSYHSDSLRLTIAVTPGFEDNVPNLWLVARSRNVICYGAGLNFKINNTITKKIPKTLFAEGIAEFSILNGFNPLSQRLAFIAAKDSVLFNISTDSLSYAPGDSIAVLLSFTDNNGAGINGNLSIAVTDDTQVKSDSAGQNIISQILLSSDLKGYIEDPGFYFYNHDSIAGEALDNLLLTQGWIGYSWDKIFQPVAPSYEAEHEFMVKGRVSNVLNKKIAGAHIGLISQKPVMFKDTITDAAGRFIFHRFPLIDTPVFFIQARNKQGKSFNAGITVDDVKPPEFISPKVPVIMPWYVNIDSTTITLAQVKQEIDKKLLEGMTLAPVIVVAKKKVDGSFNLNGSGNADIVLDEADMEKTGKKTLLDLLQEKLPGFHEGLFPPLGITHDIFASRPEYLIQEKQVVLVIDGINVDNDYIPFEGDPAIEPRNRHMQFLKAYLDYYTAEDIKGIEISYSSKYNAAYNIRYHKDDNVAAGFTWAYIEVTTRGGKGPYMKITPGTYLYKSTPFSWPAKFYSPHYAVKDTSDHSADLRSTIYWAPNIITDSSGKATVSFYAADRAATYTLIVEGTDFNGNLVVRAKKIIIKGKR
ncbi:MAG TPA: hypothetical protein VG738_03000 [Chitinophagaceae bacterium]|nr:hypothetical protein [Chitinophagaceae bacterium]